MRFRARNKPLLCRKGATISTRPIASLRLAVALSLIYSGLSLGADPDPNINRDPRPDSDQKAVDSAAPDGEVRRWRTALAQVREGQYHAALSRLEPLVSQYPDNTRFRLELARTLFWVGQQHRAEYHFDLALSDKTLSDADVSVANQYLDAIDRRSDWSSDFSFAIAPQTNPGQRTSSETVEIAGRRFTINSRSRESSGTGFSIDAGSRWAPPITELVKGRFEVDASHEAYPNDAFNDSQISVAGGFDFTINASNEIGLSLTAEKRWAATEPFSQGRGMEIRSLHHIDRNTVSFANLELIDLEYDSLDKRDGVKKRLALGGNHTFNPRFVGNGSVFITDKDAADDSRAYHEFGLQVGGRYAVSGGFIPGVQAWVIDREYEAAQRFFPEARTDERWGVSATLTHRSLSWQGFAPELSVTYRERTSNISLYNYENAGVSIGVTRSF